MLEKRWETLMDSFRFEENQSEFLDLKKKYSETHRAYHNLDHLTDCLFQLDQFPDPITDKQIIEMAIWYHDIIYNPYQKDNELKSAEAASQFLSDQNTDSLLIQKVYDLIMSTLHVDAPKNDSEALIMDIDITILGSTEVIYLEYCTKIRKEYKWVPGILYRKKRKEILQRFLLRERLYYTVHFHLQFEQQARINIAEEIKRLS